MNQHVKVIAVFAITVCSLTGCASSAKTVSMSYEISPAAIERFSDVNGRIDQIEEALIKGYAPLVDDLENGKLSTVTEEKLTGYACSAADMRTIGFPNWITEIRGHVLLEKVRELDWQIKLLKAQGAPEDEISTLTKAFQEANRKLEQMAIEERVD